MASSGRDLNYRRKMEAAARARLLQDSSGH